MLVYGDVTRLETVGKKRDLIETALRGVAKPGVGIERHAALVSAFVTAGELVQGIADFEFQRTGFDAVSDAQATGMAFLVDLALLLDRSWRSGFAPIELPTSLTRRLASLDGTVAISCRKAEGYAFYALYPEAYLQAAACSGLGADTQVIGIRSIGTGLAALVAAGIGAEPPVTVRPVGDPRCRELKIGAALAARLRMNPRRDFAVVDEGPGLTGSSFGAVADWLEANGVARHSIHFFPSHDNDLGPRASKVHRSLWGSVARHVVSAEDVLLRPPGECRSLAEWLETLLGPLDCPLRDISGGASRAERYASTEEWPASNIQQERRKYMARAGGQSWLVKFAGLGELGEQKLQTGRLLHHAGFTPSIAGLRHGFLVEKWHEHAPSLDQVSFDRDRLIERIGAYLGFRGRHLESAGSQGASLEALAHMAVHNARMALGDSAADALAGVLCRWPELQHKVRPVDTDNRMHAWEWLIVDQQLIKTDALDHSTAHDLIGHQDIAWDVAGARIEFHLAPDETRRLCAIVEACSARVIDPDVLAYMQPCYLAFQLGAFAMAADAISPGEERVRLQAMSCRYAALLEAQLKSVTICHGD
ncbi:hypothetical protein [Microvirga brassicacearum]|uniref:Uncharacterized protein n=1 Tax=Microvirga brassicacearum TaxID=2580413 RepID=A0A5N3P3Y9_9HYPH|nr:hypothetical protein [Microvirga brassicacearum]KAB0264434.1 hypothetical protein FEZ63_22630 [Microvirga brassicacearum]